MTDTTRRVLVIGWDAADWKIINALIEQGKMPHTAALIERGVMGNLATLQPVLSPMLWTSIATGKRPFKHGILGFTEPTPDGGGVQPVSQLARDTKAIWNILHQQGLRSHVIGWWPSHPVEPINGIMVSNHYHTAVADLDQPWPLAPGMVHPKRLEATLAELRVHPNELTPEQVLPFVPRAAEIDQDKDRRLASVMKTLAECASVHAAATWAMANEPWDFMGVYYDAIDHFCHGFMKYHPPRRPHIPERDYELYHGVVEAGYRFHDMMLGAMLKLAPQDTTVIVCSDHGFHSDHLRPVALPKEPAAPAIEHRDLGMFIVAGPGIKRDHLIHGATLLDITPTILTLYGLPVGKDMDGRPLLEAFENPPQVTTIASWDNVPGDDARLSSDLHYDPLAAKEAMDQLVALGYVEQPDDNREKAIANTVRELRYNLARSYMDAGQHRKAAPILAELYAAESDQYRFGVQLALCHRALGEVAALRALVEKMTDDRRQAAEQAREDLKAFADQVKQRLVAEGQGSDSDELNPEALTEEEAQRYHDLRLLARFNRFDLDYLMGWVLAAEGDHAAALVHLQQAGRSDARRPGLHLQIGEACLTLRRLEDAENAYRRVLRLDPLNPHGHLGLARIALRRKQTRQAVETALESIRLQYHNPLAHYVLGAGLLRMVQLPRAREALEVALSINPRFEQAHRLLAWVLRILGEHGPAQRHRNLANRIRSARRGRMEASATPAAELAELAPEVDQEGGRAVFKPGLETLVDKSAVPDDPARCVIVVAGLPRSGTSLMMQMLAAGGLEILSDGKRKADTDNPRGYYELEAATRLRGDRAWLKDATGKGVKIVAQLLPFLPREYPYRAIFMERDLEEVLRSQTVMLGNLGRERVKLTNEQLKIAYRQQLRQVKVWLAHQPNIRILFVGHREALENPIAVAERVADFVGGALDPAAMAEVVDRTLYRQRVG